MKVTGQNSVNRILNAFLKNIGKTVKSQDVILTAANQSYEKGVAVEDSPQILALKDHFADVPDFEYNSKQENLVIVGPVMGGSVEELLEV